MNLNLNSNSSQVFEKRPNFLKNDLTKKDIEKTHLQSDSDFVNYQFNESSSK
jgi:hypothetical protein